MTHIGEPVRLTPGATICRMAALRRLKALIGRIANRNNPSR
ncbi:hypothetical protein [Mesorhizobium sp.]|nr:hypothetical protein [Mesorhizobium sp.]